MWNNLHARILKTDIERIKTRLITFLYSLFIDYDKPLATNAKYCTSISAKDMLIS